MNTKNINADKLIHLGHMDFIQEGDFIFDDFNSPQFTVGLNHPRLGTRYDCFLDMPVYRHQSKMPTRLTS